MPQKKRLILTYGLSEGRQRTVALSLKRVNSFLAVLAVMAIWSAGTLGYFALRGFRTEAVAVATVEPALASAPEPRPEVCDPPAPEIAVADRVEKPEIAVAEPVEKPDPVPVAASAPEPVVAAVAEEKPAEPENQLAATIEGYRAEETIGKLVTHFSVRNLTNATLRGKVRGEAEFVALDGSRMTITSEQDYKARTLSTKQLRFTAPGPGKFTKIRITVDDRASQRAVVFFR